MIEVCGLVKEFDGKTVLDNISARFERGKVNLIIGRSGSGKTVLMKCMVGLLIPDGGRILYDGRDFYGLTIYEQRRLRVQMGMVFQSSALFDSMTVGGNVQFPLDMFTDMSRDEKRARVDFCLERVDLKGVNRQYPSQLSGGMKKRAAIARAIACRPQYLFCDEPNSGLDPKTSLIIDGLLTEITHEAGITTVINTHDLNSILTIGENIVFIHEGLLAWNGSKEQVRNSGNALLDDFIHAHPSVMKTRQKL